MHRHATCCAITCICLMLLPATAAQQTVGLFLDSEDAYEGFTLFAPQTYTVTYLINNQGRLIHSWPSSHLPAVSVYLLENGSILRTAVIQNLDFVGGGQGGRVEEISWDGLIVWEYEYSTSQVVQHHDIERLPNGNVLIVAWEKKSAVEAIAAGRDPANMLDGEVWPDHIIEVEPVGASSGNIVWEWHAWDHLVQDFDPTKLNFGVVADHPELIDINFGPPNADWQHVNAVDYNAALDQIILSPNRISEIWIIDHSTTTEQAAGHTGGNSGRGGDLLYRWGNPQAYGRGTELDRKLYSQHDPQWIDSGLPGAGNILLFNNGNGRSPVKHSSVDEFTTPVDQNGDYPSPGPGSAFGPTALIWTYFSNPLEDFFEPILGGAQRQPNGDTLICKGRGRFFEVTPALATVWEYHTPVSSQGPVMQGSNAGGVFRAPRYSPDYAAFVGRDLTPGDRIEIHDTPLPALDGTAGSTPLTVTKLNTHGGRLELTWDVSSCVANDYNIIYGSLDDVSTLALQGSVCSISNVGTYTWVLTPPAGFFFLLVGADDTGVYESSWGLDSAGEERRGLLASYECSATNADFGATCP